MKKIKELFSTCCVLLFALNTAAQQQVSMEKDKKAAIGVTFSSLGKSNVIHFGEGSAYNENDYLYSLGVNYTYLLNSWLEAETGIEYSKHRIKLFIYPDGITRFYGEKDLSLISIPLVFALNTKGILIKDLSLISIPLVLRANFSKFFFINAGTLIDFDFAKDNEIIDNQTGMGFTIGLGVKYDFKCGISLFANPFLRLHSLIYFVPDKLHNRLCDGGVRFGITYNLK